MRLVYIILYRVLPLNCTVLGREYFWQCLARLLFKAALLCLISQRWKLNLSRFVGGEILTIYFFGLTYNLVVRIIARINVMWSNIGCCDSSREFAHLNFFIIVPLKDITRRVIDLEGTCWRTKYWAALVKVARNNLGMGRRYLVYHILALLFNDIYRLVMRKDLRHRIDVYWRGVLRCIHCLQIGQRT